MPCTIKIRIHSARDLPIMDRKSKLTDAFVTIRFAPTAGQPSSSHSHSSSHQQHHKAETRIARRSLNPVWNEDFRFEVGDDVAVQEQLLECVVWDKDTYTADDPFGSVRVDLCCLLRGGGDDDWTLATGGSTAAGGDKDEGAELDGVGGGGGSISRLVPAVRYHQRHTRPSAPHHQAALFPVHQPAISNLNPALLHPPPLHFTTHPRSTAPYTRPPLRCTECRRSRVRVDGQLSCQSHIQRGTRRPLQRRPTAASTPCRERCEELGGNAVVGWRVALDLEGEVGVVVARAHGTAVTMGSGDKRINAAVSSSGSKATDRSGERAGSATSKDESIQQSQADNTNAITAVGGSNSADSAAIQLDKLQPTDKPAPLSTADALTASSVASNVSSALSRSYRRDVHLITMSSFPVSLQLVLGGLVVARSVKLLTSNTTTTTHEKWWTEIRKEVKSHATSLHCTHVLGYSEQCVVTKDVVVLSGYGTAARGGWLNERDGRVGASWLRSARSKCIEGASCPVPLLTCRSAVVNRRCACRPARVACVASAGCPKCCSPHSPYTTSRRLHLPSRHARAHSRPLSADRGACVSIEA